MIGYLMRHLTRRQKDIFEAFDGYEENDWPQFLASIRSVFPMGFRPKHNRRSLAHLTSESAKHPIQTISALAAYYREFNAIARYLLKQESISEYAINRQFWFGLHESTRERFRDRLKVIYKTNGPYPYAGIFEAGLWVLEWDEELEADGMVNPHKEPTPEDAQPFPNTPSDEISSLLGKLPYLKLQDSEYAVVYNKIKTISSSTAALFKEPTATSHPASTKILNTGVCIFCEDTSGGHRTRTCPVGRAYMKEGKVTINSKGFWVLANGDRIPNHPPGLKHAVDQHYAAQASKRRSSRSYHVQVNDPETASISSSITKSPQSPSEETENPEEPFDAIFQEIMKAAFRKDEGAGVDLKEIPYISPYVRKYLANYMERLENEDLKAKPDRHAKEKSGANM